MEEGRRRQAAGSYLYKKQGKGRMNMLRPLHQGISVPDMEASVAWYREVLGCRVLSDEVVPPLNARIVFLDLDGFQLELFQYLGADGKPLPEERRTPDEDLKVCGTKHVAYAVDDMDAMKEVLKAHRVTVIKPRFRMGDDWVMFIADNAGTLLELIQVGGAVGS